MKSLVSRRGYTLVELLITIGMIGMALAVIAGICVGVHFIIKFW